MADVVAMSHGGDGGNSPPRGPSRRIGTNCQRSKSKAANPNAKIGKGGKVVRGPTKNTTLKAKVALDRRPVSIDFRVKQRTQMEMELVMEFVRSFPGWQERLQSAPGSGVSPPGGSGSGATPPGGSGSGASPSGESRDTGDGSGGSGV